MKLSELARAAVTHRWNNIVAKRWRWLYDTTTRHVFLHPTKGYRQVSKMRIGVA